MQNMMKAKENVPRVPYSFYPIPFHVTSGIRPQVMPCYIIKRLQHTGIPKWLVYSDAVASLGLVSPTVATHGCHPTFFLKKSDDLFFCQRL